MGINCLLPFLKEVTEKVHIDKFRGQTAAIDGSCWLHKALTVSITRTGNFDR
jgi:exonuclease-1